MKPFVHVSYETHRTFAAYRAAIHRRCGDAEIDFMDGIVHAKDRYVLSLGRFVDRAPYVHRYDWTRVYFESTARRREDYLRTADYFFRYDHGVTNVHPRSGVGRLLLGKFLHSEQLLRLAATFRHLLPARRPDVTLDVFVPSGASEAFLAWYEKEIGFFPLWCVPYRRVRDYEWLAPSFYAAMGADDDLFLDLAIYGMRQPRARNVYKEIEDALLRVGGVKTLISHNYYDESVFWSIWNRDNYDAVKRVTDPEHMFRDLYAKTCRAMQGLEEKR
jgi:hypothetical protein